MLQSEWKHLGYNAGRYLGKLIKSLGYAPGSPAVRGLLRFVRAPPRIGSTVASLLGVSDTWSLGEAYSELGKQELLRVPSPDF